MQKTFKLVINNLNRISVCNTEIIIVFVTAIQLLTIFFLKYGFI